MIFCSSFILSSDTKAELIFPSLRRLDWGFLKPLEANAPDIVGTTRGLSLGRVLEGGGGGRQGALGGGGLGWGLLVLSGLLIRNLSAGLLNLTIGILKVQGCWSLGRLLMMRRAGTILFDFELRMYIAVESKTVTPTNTPMITMTMPRAFIGLSLLFIKKTAIGPLRGVCKRAQIKSFKSSPMDWIHVLEQYLSKACKHERWMCKALTEEAQTTCLPTMWHSQSSIFLCPTQQDCCCKANDYALHQLLGMRLAVLRIRISLWNVTDEDWTGTMTVHETEMEWSARLRKMEIKWTSLSHFDSQIVWVML